MKEDSEIGWKDKGGKTININKIFAFDLVKLCKLSFLIKEEH